MKRKRPVEKDYHGFDGPLPVSSDYELNAANQAFLDAGTYKFMEARCDNSVTNVVTTVLRALLQQCYKRCYNSVTSVVTTVQSTCLHGLCQCGSICSCKIKSPFKAGPHLKLF